MSNLQDDFIKKAVSIYGNRYDYTGIVYKNSFTPVNVLCPKHGNFIVTPTKHLNRRQECPVCKQDRVNKEKTDRMLEHVEVEAKTKYNGKFTNIVPVDKTVTNKHAKLKIVCPVHGEFVTTIGQFLTKSKYGCRKCGEAAAAESKVKDTDWFIDKAKVVHGDKYKYNKTVYVRATEHTTITCPLHGDFKQTPSAHLAGYGCRHCVSYGGGKSNLKGEVTLYYLKIKNTELFKIGVTSQLIAHRYRSSFDREQIEVVFTKKYSTGSEAYRVEQLLLRKYSKYKFIENEKVLKGNGNTELMTCDVLRLYNKSDTEKASTFKEIEKRLIGR